MAQPPTSIGSSTSRGSRRMSRSSTSRSVRMAPSRETTSCSTRNATFTFAQQVKFRSDWLVNEQGIAPHVPVIDKSKREDGTFSRDDFLFDKERDIYICPAGKIPI